MPLPAAVLFVAALLATALAAAGWWLDPESAPSGGRSLAEAAFAKATEGGLWSGLLLFLVAAAFLAWRGRRADGPAAGAPPRGTAGRDEPEG